MMNLVGIGIAPLDIAARIEKGSAAKLLASVVGLVSAGRIASVIQRELQKMGFAGCQVAVGGGGSIANSLVAAARRGQKCAFISAVGKDNDGRRVRQAMSRAGVNVRGLRSVEGKRTSVCALALTPRLANAKQQLVKTKPELRLNLRNRKPPAPPFVLLTNKTGAAVVNLAHQANGYVMAIDNFSERNGVQERVLRCLPSARIVVFSENVLREFALRYSFETNQSQETAAGVALALLKDFDQLELVVVTLGAQGAVWALRGHDPQCQPACPVIVVDPTGAGDAFLGTLIAYLMQKGWPDVKLDLDTVSTAIAEATVAAAHVVGSLGARPSVSNVPAIATAPEQCRPVIAAARKRGGHPMRVHEERYPFPFGPVRSFPVPVILDTDIGTDVDDVIALATILASPELFQLRAVVCTYNPPEITSPYPDGSGTRHRLTRAYIARTLLALQGGEAATIPVGVTWQAPLASKRSDVYWGGWEGSGVLNGNERFADLDPPPDGVELMLESIRSSQDPVVILSIAPMTTLAIALQQEPQLLRDKVLGIAAMSGSLRRQEQNIRCDHGAAEVVYGSGIPLAIITADVTEKFRLTARDRTRLSATTPFGKAVLGQVDEYCRLMKRRWTLLHDPLAVLAPFVDEARFCDATLSPLAGGAMMKFASPSQRPVKVCLDVDLPQLKDRLCDALTKLL